MHVNCIIVVASLWALLCDMKMFTSVKSPPDCGMNSVIRLWTQEMVCLLTCIARFVMPKGLMQWVTEREIGWRGSQKIQNKRFLINLLRGMFLITHPNSPDPVLSYFHLFRYFKNNLDGANTLIMIKKWN